MLAPGRNIIASIGYTGRADPGFLEGVGVQGPRNGRPVGKAIPVKMLII